MHVTHFTRRSFLIALNLSLAGLALGVFDEPAHAFENTVTSVKSAFDPNVFVHVATSGEVTIVCHRSEMGQGVRSTIPVIIADELGADMARVRILQADGDKAYGDQNTDGSSSIRKQFDELRHAAATARTMLVAAAAEKLGVPAASLKAEKHRVVHAATKRTLGFGELAELAAKLPVPDPKKVELRPDSELTLVGTELPLADAPAFVTGKAIYGADVRVPGELVAVIARPPVVGSSVVRFDSEKALAIPGVKRVIQMPEPKKPYKFQPWGGVAVLADNTWAAMRGRAALKIEWSASENDGYDSEKYRESLLKAVAATGTVRQAKGDAESALAKATARLEADYYVPHLPHASMEPPSATARFTNGRLEIWTCTQHPQAARTEGARVLGIPESDVTVHVTFLGGAFGRKSKADFASEAAFLAKESGSPVRVQWTREDDIQHDYYNAVSAQRLSAGFDARGKVVAWRRRTSFPPIRSIFEADADMADGSDLQQGVLDLALDVPNVRTETCAAKAHVRIGWLRSVFNIFHGFANGAFFDEIASHRKLDPRDNLLELVGKPRKLSLKDLGIDELKNYGSPLDEHPVDAGRLRGVIERVTRACNWKDRAKDGRALGLAAHRSFLSYVAAVVSLKKDANDGRVRVDEVWITLDAGLIVNHERARSQMEGAVIFGMTLALFGGVTFRDGRAMQSNLHDLRLLRIGDAPREIHVELVDSKQRPGGIGEPGVPPIAPALANAYFALMGKRVRELPLGKHFGVTA